MNQQELVTSDLDFFFKNLDLCRNKNYSTHGLHPYPAKFIPHIPRALVTHIGLEGMPVLDPMCGSGTTLVEATSLGFSALGVDLNPIAVLASHVKTLQLTDTEFDELEQFATRLRAAGKDPGAFAREGVAPDFPNRSKWLDQHIAQELMAILSLTGELSSRAQAVAQLSLSAIVVSVSNQESETRWRAVSKNHPPGIALEKTADRIDSGVERLRLYRASTDSPSIALRADARALPIGTDTVGAIVTSPPYANSHDYYLYNKLRLFLLGHDVSAVQQGEIGSRNRHSDWKAPFDDYLAAMQDALCDWRRVLVRGGKCAIVVGDAVIRGEFFNMAEELAEVAQRVGFNLTEAYAFSHRRFNGSFQRGFGTSIKKLTHVLIFV